MHSFTNDGSALKKLSNKTWEMDSQWMNELDADDWKSAIIDFQNKLTDSIIERAVNKMPAEVYAYSGKELTRKLKNRRNGLLVHAMRYYKFLAGNVYVLGTDEGEYFKVTAEGDRISVTAFSKKSGSKDNITYQRTFNENDTRKIFIIGLGGKDHFEVDEKVSSSITLQLEGGKGDDVYSVRGKIRTKIEDKSIDSKKVLATAHHENR
jgi:hypothetical protein